MNTVTLSPAAQVIIAVIPIVGIIIGGVLIFFCLLWYHKQASLQIQLGTYTPPRFDFYIFALLVGLLLTGVGTVLTVIFALLERVSYALLGGLIPLVIGIAMLVFARLYRTRVHCRDA